MKGLTDIAGIRVGQVSDFEAITGCTAILCEAGAVGGVDIRGSATGTQEIATLDPGEHAALEATGATIEFMPYLSGFSTTQLIAKIKAAGGV